MNAWFDRLQEPWRILVFLALLLPCVLASNSHPYLAVAGFALLFILRLGGF